MKLRRIFYEDFVIMQHTGRCTMMLYMVILVLRGAMQAETQEIEGWNSLVQTMCKRSPHMQWPLANSRMNLKLSPAISASSCASVLKQIGEYMASVQYAGRFQPCSDADLVGLPPEAQRPPACFHELLAWIWLLSSGLALRVKDKVLLTCRFVYELVSFGGVDLPETACFVASWSYRRMIHCFVGSMFLCNGEGMFELPMQVSPQKLSVVLGSVYQGLIEDGLIGPSDRVRTCQLRKHLAEWRPGSLKVAKVGFVEDIDVEMKRFPRETMPQGRPTAVDAIAALLDDDVQGAEFGLEGELEELIANEFGGGDDDGADANGLMSHDQAEEDGAEDTDAGDLSHDTPEYPDPFPIHSLHSAPAAQLEGIVAALHRRRLDGARVVAEAQRLAILYNAIPPTVESISLVRIQSDVSDEVVQADILFVRWTDFAERRARVVRLDDQNGIVYNIPFLVPVREFPEQSTHILVSRLPVSMLKVKKDDRMHMDSWALELLVHHRAQIMAGASLDDATPCVLCDLSMQALGCVSLDADRFVCSRCSLRWHASCCALMSATLGVEDTCAGGLGSLACPVCEASN